MVTDRTTPSHASLTRGRTVPATTIKMAKNDKTGGNTGREKDTKNILKAPLKMPMEAPRIERGTVCRYAKDNAKQKSYH